MVSVKEQGEGGLVLHGEVGGPSGGSGRVRGGEGFTPLQSFWIGFSEQ